MTSTNKKTSHNVVPDKPADASPEDSPAYLFWKIQSKLTKLLSQLRKHKLKASRDLTPKP